MRTLIFMSALAAGLAGCAGQVDAPLAASFGQAVATMDTQIVPAPVSDEAPVGAGVTAVAAIERYRKGEVKQPQVQATSNARVTFVPYEAGK